MDGSGYYTCPAQMRCGTPMMVGLPTSSDESENLDLINYGITTFDNIFVGFMTIF